MASITQKPGLKKGTTTKLRHPIMLEPTNSNLLLTTKDKLVIIFRHLEKYVVYRKSDSTVAVITNPDFKTKNPPITYDGCLMEEMFGNVQLSLMYAVAMYSHESAEIQLKPKDIILVLAQAGENYLLGITSANMVGCFPSEKVVLLTMPRPFLHPGLMIKVKARLKLILEDITILPGEMYNIIKGKDDPFDWRLLISQRRVPLGFFIEEEIKVHILPSPHKDEDSTSQTVQKDPFGTPHNENDDTVQMEQKKYCPQYDTIQGKNQHDILYRPNEQKVEHDYVNGPKAYHNREDIQESINQLSVYRNVPINDELRSTVAQYVDDKVWHELGTKIGVPKQRCREIESQKETVYEKIYDLLGIWHEELKSNAKVGVLLDALADVNPKDLHLILEDILRIVKDEQNRDPNQGIYENKRNIDDTNQDLGATSFDSQEQAQFEMKNELAQLRKFHIRRTQLEMEDLLVKLRDFQNIPVNEALRKILAEYMEPDVWHQFGERIRIPITERIKIETEKYDIYEMTYDLLGNWLNKYESTATLGVLLDALVDVNPKHLNLLLKDILAEVEDCLDDSYQEIPEDETIYGTSRPNEAPYDKADESDVFGRKNGNLCYNDGPKEVNNALYELGEGNGFNRENLYYNDDSYEFKGANKITFGARTELRLDFSHHQIFDVQETEYAKENGKTFFFRTKGTKCLNASSLISKDGGEIEIPAAGVKLQIPPESFEEDHFLTLKILPSLSYKGPGSSFEDNSTVMVEILPNNLTLKQPAKLTLPHCLILKEPKRCPVKIFHSHHCADQSPDWEDITKSVQYELSDSTCTIWIEHFSWIKYEIGDKLVKGKKLFVYTLGERYMRGATEVTAEVGYFPALPGNERISLDTDDFRISSKGTIYESKLGEKFQGDWQSFIFWKEPKHPLLISITEIIPADSWEASPTSSCVKDISYRNIELSNEQSRPFTFQRKKDTASFPVCHFTISQGEEFSEVYVNMKKGIIREEANDASDSNTNSLVLPAREEDPRTRNDFDIQHNQHLLHISSKQEDTQRRIHLKQELQTYWQMEINDQLRNIVAEYLEPELFHDVGRKLGVHRNRRTQIERERIDICQRTYELLGQWHQRLGQMATIGTLIECLEPFNPEDFNTMLEELFEEVGYDYLRIT